MFGNASAGLLFQGDSRPTQHAPNGWESPRFHAFSWVGVGSGKVAFSPPAPARVTQTVSAPVSNNDLINKKKEITYVKMYWM